MMTTNDFKFGVEIEFAGAMTDVVAERMDRALAGTGERVALERYNHTTRNHWKVTTDATVSRQYDLRSGIGEGGEVVSPVLQGDEGFERLRLVLDALNSVEGVRVDRRCGVHVHLSWGGMDADWVANIVDRYTRHEDLIDSWMAPSRRGSISRWCGAMAPVKQRVDRAKETLTMTTRYLAQAPRYQKVNLQSLMSHGTVEFRQHQGSTEFAKIANWIRFLMGFVDASRHYSSAPLPSRRVRGESRRAYGEVRYNLENAGFQMNYAGGRRWNVTNENGHIAAVLTNDELDEMYRTFDRVLSHRFIEFYDALIETTNRNPAGDSVFNGVPTETVDYLYERMAQFAA